MDTEAQRKATLLKSLKDKRWEVYKAWNTCHCPALNSDVHFTQDGFFHLHTEPSGRVRTVANQLHRYQSLIHVPEVIKNCSKFLTYEKRFAPLGRGRKKNGKLIVKEFEYWSLVEHIKGLQIKVVLRKLVHSEKIIFWSVMAYTSKNRPKAIL